MAFPVAMADVTLAPLFCDHAIVQRDQPVPVWGRAQPGEHVLVAYRGQQVGATTDRDGRWIVYLEAMPASADPADLTVTGKTTATVHDVLIGEVWLASGQSNMTRELSSVPDAPAVIAKINNPLIRHINIAQTVADQPADTVPTSGWQPATPATAGSFSAIAWYFSRELQRKLEVPVGIIHSSWGATPIESWTDRRTLQSTSVWPAIEARWQDAVATFPARQDAYPAWEKAEAEAKATGKKNPLPWPGPLEGPGTRYQLSTLFDGMIAPLQPYALRGVIWYQGERNRFRPAEYGEIFRAMIKAWRAQWGEDDLPFLFVQLPNYVDPDDKTGRSWARLREAQASAFELPATGMAVTIDCGDPKDVHPQNKPMVGQRLARIAEHNVYDLVGDWSGPRFVSAIREGKALRVRFEHADTGLISENTPPQALELAGADHKFHPATATIENNMLLVSSPAVPDPVAVRYAWSNNPEANLFNGAGLPVAPFRSDDW